MDYKLILCILFLFLGTGVLAQKLSPDEYLSDLNFIYKSLKATPSFKVQKSNRNNLKNQYQKLLSEPMEEMYLIDALENYSRLLDALNDLHNGITSISDRYTYQELQDQQKLNRLLLFTDGIYEKSNLNLDSLEQALDTKLGNDYEGVYFYNNLIKVAVVKSADKLIGVVLDSKIPSWSRSEVMFYLIPKGNDSFRMISGTFLDKQLVSTMNCFKNGEFLGFGWKKSHVNAKYYNAVIDSNIYSIKQVYPNVDYLKVSSFSASNKMLSTARTFYKKLRDDGLSEHLIVDLRNNGGGGDKNSNYLYKVLKDHRGTIYLLINYSTMSNAEQFVLKVKDLPNVYVFGDRTAGILTFGYNYGRSELSPSNRFKLKFTDLKDNWRKYLPFEGIGVKPDVYLKADRDWLEQTLEIIKSKATI